MSANALTFFFVDRFTVERYIGRLAGRVAFSRMDDRLSPIFLSRFFFVPFARRLNQTYSTKLLAPLLIERKKELAGNFEFRPDLLRERKKDSKLGSKPIFFSLYFLSKLELVEQ